MTTIDCSKGRGSRGTGEGAHRSTDCLPVGLRWVTPCVAVVVLSTLMGCVTEPITGRTLLGGISEEDANQMGATAYEQMLAEAPVASGTADAALVQKVGERIARVVDQRMAEEGRPRYEWEFNLINANDTVNAFALPGGKVAFYSGILPICQGEAGIAVVMGHEIAHAYGQHGRKRVSEQAVSQYGLEAVQIALDSGLSADESQLALAALGIGYQYGVELPFSRGDEAAADHIGLIIMAEAGYDPRVAVDFWTRMAEASGEAPLEFFSTHPSNEKRIRKLKERMPAAVEIYEKNAN